MCITLFPDYAGLHNGTHCKCADDLNEDLVSDDAYCNSDCTVDNPTLKCGGENHTSIFYSGRAVAVIEMLPHLLH